MSRKWNTRLSVGLILLVLAPVLDASAERVGAVGGYRRVGGVGGVSEVGGAGEVSRVGHGPRNVDAAQGAALVHGSSQYNQLTDADVAAINTQFKTQPLQGNAVPVAVASQATPGQPLPVGAQKSVLPAAVVANMPAYPGYSYYAVGKNVVLINDKTQVVSDVLPNVLQ